MESFITYAPMVGLLFFFIVFLGIAFCTLRPGAKQRLQAQAYIPLQEDTHG
jgi:cbb3-type cytochrome oxidase subunit 3